MHRFYWISTILLASALVVSCSESESKKPHWETIETLDGQQGGNDQGQQGGQQGGNDQGQQGGQQGGNDQGQQGGQQGGNDQGQQGGNDQGQQGGNDQGQQGGNDQGQQGGDDQGQQGGNDQGQQGEDHDCLTTFAFHNKWTSTASGGTDNYDVYLIGDFNVEGDKWKEGDPSYKMQADGNGAHIITVKWGKGETHQYKYYVNGWGDDSYKADPNACVGDFCNNEVTVTCGQVICYNEDGDFDCSSVSLGSGYVSGEQPGGDNPGGDNPGGDNPGGDNPGGDNPGGDNPGGQNSAVVSECNVQFAASPIKKGEAFESYSRVRVDGITGQNGSHSGLKGQFGYVVADLTKTLDDVIWSDAVRNEGYDSDGSDVKDEYMSTSVVASEAGMYAVFYRYSTDNGANWTYCDKAGIATAVDVNNVTLVTVEDKGGEEPPATDAKIEWCQVTWPTKDYSEENNSFASGEPIKVYGQVRATGITGKNGTHTGIKGRFGYVVADISKTMNDVVWSEAQYNSEFNGEGSDTNDEYMIADEVKPAPGYYVVFYAFSVDNGATWVGCDGAGMLESADKLDLSKIVSIHVTE